MKTCSSCNTSKPLTEYGKAKWSKKDGLNSQCKDCYREYLKEHYERTKEHHRLISNASKQKRIEKIHEWLADYLKAHPCVDCGNTDILVLEFDHVNEEKEDDVSRIVRSTAVLFKVQAEVAKCEVRCVNCHREITRKRRESNND